MFPSHFAFTYLGIICRWHSIKESSNLCSQIANHNKLFQNIFGQNVSVSSFFDVIWTDINMIGSQMQVGGRNSTHSPFSFGGKSIRLVVARCTENQIEKITCKDTIWSTVFVDKLAATIGPSIQQIMGRNIKYAFRTETWSCQL